MVIIIAILISLMWICAATEKPKLMKDDLPFIACDVCNRVAESLFSTLFEKVKYSQINEAKIEDILDTICRPESDAGKWIRYLDIVQKNNQLQLNSPGGISKCANECTTISSSCLLLLTEEFDIDDIILYLWKNKDKLINSNVNDLKKYLCDTKRCNSNSKHKFKLSKNRKDEIFKPLTAKDIEVENLMTNMKSAGVPGLKAYDRESMMERMMEEYGLDEDEMELLKNNDNEML